MKKKLLTIALFAFALICLNSAISYGAISATSGTVNSGENVTISVSSAETLGAYAIQVTNNGGLTFVRANPPAIASANGTIISGASTSGVTSLGSFTFKTPSVSTDTTFYVKIASSGTEGPGPNYAAVAPSTATATIIVKAPQVSTPPPTTPTPPPVTQPSPVAPTFSNASGTVYATTDVNVRSSYSTSSSLLGQLKEGESVTRTGVSTTSVNGYTWTRVTFNGKTGYIASKFLTTTKPETPPSTEPSTPPSTAPTEKSNDATLKSLSITGVQIAPEFASNVTSYTANVGEDITKVEVLATANNEKATVEITGNENLQDGENSIVVKVTAEDGTVSNYEIKLTKGTQEKPLIAVMGIKENGEKVELLLQNPTTVSEGIVEYTINLTEWLKAVDIVGTLSDESSQYEGIGTFDLVVGENKYTIVLKQQVDGAEQTMEYRLTINNPEKVVPVVVENKIDYKLIALIGAGVLFAIIVVTAIVVHHKKQNDLDYGETDYSFLRDDEDIQNKEKDRNQEFLDNSSNNDDDDGNTRRGGKHF